MKKKIIILMMVFMGMITLSACGNTLEGNYVYNFPKIIRRGSIPQKKETYVFDNGTVIVKADDKRTSSEGTYTISGDKLEIRFGDALQTAKLFNDKKSFKITSVKVGGEEVPNRVHLTYTKE